MAKEGYAACRLDEPSVFYSAQWTCGKFAPVDQKTASARADWFAKRGH